MVELKQSFPLNAMFDIERILAIPDDKPDHVQMGISARYHDALLERGGIRKDGIKAKASVLKKDFSKSKEKAIIKGDRPLNTAPKPVKQREYTAGADIAKKRIQSLANQRNELVSKANELQGKILKAQNTKANRYAKRALSKRNKDNPYGLESDGMGRSFTKSAQNIKAMEAERDRLMQESERLFRKTTTLRKVWGDKIYAKEKQDSQNGVLKNPIAYYEGDPKPLAKSNAGTTKTPKVQTKARSEKPESKNLVTLPNPAIKSTAKSGRDLKSRLRDRIGKTKQSAKNKLTGTRLKVALGSAASNEKRDMLLRIQENTKVLNRKQKKDTQKKREFSGGGIYRSPIVRKKREKTARDNRLELERKGQLNIFKLLSP